MFADWKNDLCFSFWQSSGRQTGCNFTTATSTSPRIESSIPVVAEVIACLSARLNYVSACPAASGKFCPPPLLHIPCSCSRCTSDVRHFAPRYRPTRQLYFPITGLPFHHINSILPAIICRTTPKTLWIYSRNGSSVVESTQKIFELRLNVIPFWLLKNGSRKGENSSPKKFLNFPQFICELLSLTEGIEYLEIFVKRVIR